MPSSEPPPKGSPLEKTDDSLPSSNDSLPSSNDSLPSSGDFSGASDAASRWGANQPTFSSTDGSAASSDSSIDPPPRRWGRLAGPAVVLGIVAAAIAYVFAAAAIQASFASYLHPHDFWVPRAIDVVIALWALWVGSAIGSFLNVVAYRVPLGKSINGRSHCPRCDRQLAARDNVPVLGWIFLSGRCRFCRTPIPIRYPVVELAVGVCIMAVAIARIYSLSLPHTTSRFTITNLGAPRFDDWLAWLLLLYHVMAVAALWMVALVRIDGTRLPLKMVTAVLLAVGMPLLIEPMLAVVSWRQGVSRGQRFEGGVLERFMRWTTAAGAAVVLARSFAKYLSPSADLKGRPLASGTHRLVDAMVMVSIPAFVLGWQSVLFVAVMASIATAITLVCVRRPSNESAETSRPLDVVAVHHPQSKDAEEEAADDALEEEDWGVEDGDAMHGPRTFEDHGRSSFGNSLRGTADVSLERPREPDALAIFGIALAIVFPIVLTIWKPLHQQPFFPSDVSSPTIILVWAAFVILSPVWVIPAVSRHRPRRPDAIRPESSSV